MIDRVTYLSNFASSSEGNYDRPCDIFKQFCFPLLPSTLSAKFILSYLFCCKLATSSIYLSSILFRLE
jgi:hypothetical protein